MLKKSFALLLTAAFVFSVLIGCGKTSSNSGETSTAMSEVTTTATQKEELKPANLVWYIVGSEQADLKAVNDEMNKTINEKINATLELRLLDWGAYDQKLNTIIATGEEFDLCWTAPQFNDYYTNVSRKAFVPVDDLLTTYAPNLYAAVPSKYWEAAKIEGKKYAILNYQIMATAYGISAQKSILEEAGVEYTKLNSYKDLEATLAYAKKKYPNLIPLAINKNADPFAQALPMHGFFPIGDTKIPGAVKSTDDKLTVVNQYDTPEFKEFIQTMRKYYLAGYIKKDAATSEEYNNDYKAGKNVINFPAYLVNDTQDRGRTSEPGLKQDTGVDGISKRFSDTAISTDRVLATMTAISSTSKNPERAMMLLELMYNEDKLYNTIVWGVEGKHYKVVEENNAELGKVVEAIPGSGYEMGTGMAWEFGNVSKAWLRKIDDPTKYWEEANDKAITSPHLGFAFNAKDLSTEIAQCSAVVSEYLLGLTTGSIDVDKYYPQFLDKMDKAGAKKIIEEKQKQIDAWKTTK